MNSPHVLLSGSRLGLALPRRELLPEYHRWENDPRTILGYGNQFPQSWEVRDAGWERQRSNHHYPQFEVVRLDDLTAVGMTTLDVNQYVRTAEFTVVLAPEARGQGFAAEATRLTLDWAFHLGALRMVWLKVLEPNRAGIAAYEQAGFRAAGRLRRAGYWLGAPCDELIMDAVAEEFEGESWVTTAVESPVPPSA
ncbi:GNAT family N-acetyltransferase [Jiangella alkaliphila]|uniref:Protein N-acetyltransferase, RimJ/RimL family n=1 Tax=Jiangella alkaliphila TaxID=419479 RepID=A0A1H2GJZ4_9ACTN|nr:GNAT family protein [Jiangella alkaliphila]SDU19728.1 Protein N-acetyltransferase, RimJ/RimL family [Jiangella alkaliphila]